MDLRLFASVCCLGACFIELRGDEAGKEVKPATPHELDADVEKNYVFYYWKLAEKGKENLGKAPAIRKLLRHPDVFPRHYAARTLGYIGDVDSIPALMESLHDPDDVMLNFIAAEALGLLYADEALPELEKVAQDHWYPRVRSAAKEAIERIKNRTPPDPFLMTFTEYMWFDEPKRGPLPSNKAKNDEGPQQLHFRNQEDRRELKKLSYILDASDRDNFPKQYRKLGEEAVAALQKEKNKDQSIVDVVEPSRAFRVADGWMVCDGTLGDPPYPRSLMYIGDDVDVCYVVFAMGTDGVHQFGNRLIALSGIKHHGHMEAAILDLTQDQEGKWVAQVWKTLPGAPREAFELETGDLFIRTTGGDLLLTKEGKLQMYESADQSI